MPRISEFYGIVIERYWNEHNPPHFHARYAEYFAEIDIRTLKILDGWLPPKAKNLVVEWASLHRPELLSRWQDARNHKPLDRIEPLL
ncbi:MAG TPA: DUF4160 domain-containing protein [Lacipirellulaceae bacterium]|nr:DUF4160 domain-containing protein [Lacipirellulaceae bacterium]